MITCYTSSYHLDFLEVYIYIYLRLNQTLKVIMAYSKTRKYINMKLNERLLKPFQSSEAQRRERIN